MALHPSHCQCEACQERGEDMGYPAYCEENSFPATMGDTIPQWDPSDFGRPRVGSRAMGQPAFPPGVVLPPMPDSAFSPAQATNPISTAPGLWADSMQVAASLYEQAQNSPNGMAPTEAFADFQSSMQSAGARMTADGGFVMPETMPTKYVLAALAALFFL